MMWPELASKQLELLLELLPKAQQIECLTNSSNEAVLGQFNVAEIAARKRGVKLIKLDARNMNDLDNVLRKVGKAANGILVNADALFYINQTKIARAIRESKIAAVFPNSEYHKSQVLLSYGPNVRQATR